MDVGGPTHCGQYPPLGKVSLGCIRELRKPEEQVSKQFFVVSLDGL